MVCETGCNSCLVLTIRISCDSQALCGTVHKTTSMHIAIDFKIAISSVKVQLDQSIAIELHSKCS